MLIGAKSGTITLFTVSWPNFSIPFNTTLTLIGNLFDFGFTFGYVSTKTLVQTALYV